MDWLQSILSAVGGGGIVAVSASWLFKTTYESRLQRQLEESKAELARFSVEHQIRFSHLHAKRAEAMAESYSLLNELMNAARAYTAVFEVSSMGTREDRAKIAGEAMQAVRGYIPGRLIYFPKPVASSIQELLTEINRNLVQFQFLVDDPEVKAERIQKWTEIAENMTSTLPTLLEAVADAFRDLLEPGTS
ncbi:hypothetical protein [uncultured Castellaniella sp.]|uniref:hypothetical protein n=1 Tax=uncultured Castellaniella sp. TaxID=647907 RepID=UPI00261CE2CF|nr:hypothetical protein [uncultured Castellaniella sp.]